MHLELLVWTVQGPGTFDIFHCPSTRQDRRAVKGMVGARLSLLRICLLLLMTLRRWPNLSEGQFPSLYSGGGSGGVWRQLPKELL